MRLLYKNGHSLSDRQSSHDVSWLCMLKLKREGDRTSMKYCTAEVAK